MAPPVRGGDERRPVRVPESDRRVGGGTTHGRGGDEELLLPSIRGAHPQVGGDDQTAPVVGFMDELQLDGEDLPASRVPHRPVRVRADQVVSVARSGGDAARARRHTAGARAVARALGPQRRTVVLRRDRPRGTGGARWRRGDHVNGRLRTAGGARGGGGAPKARGRGRPKNAHPRLGALATVAAVGASTAVAAAAAPAVVTIATATPTAAATVVARRWGTPSTAIALG